ncbi:hypothetical protein H0W26_03700 [Candidatus Dependentiae bacterium]|nr:hypothetical protein [Candidatus Dependentiae bacterium]
MNSNKKICLTVKELDGRGIALQVSDETPIEETLTESTNGSLEENLDSSTSRPIPTGPNRPTTSITGAPLKP